MTTETTEKVKLPDEYVKRETELFAELAKVEDELSRIDALSPLTMFEGWAVKKLGIEAALDAIEGMRRALAEKYVEDARVEAAHAAHEAARCEAEFLSSWRGKFVEKHPEKAQEIKEAFRTQWKLDEQKRKKHELKKAVRLSRAKPLRGGTGQTPG